MKFVGDVVVYDRGTYWDHQFVNPYAQHTPLRSASKLKYKTMEEVVRGVYIKESILIIKPEYCCKNYFQIWNPKQ